MLVPPRELSGILNDSSIEGEYRVGDLTDSKAQEYLTTKRQLKKETTAKLVEFCGPRILHLASIVAFPRVEGILTVRSFVCRRGLI